MGDTNLWLKTQKFLEENTGLKCYPPATKLDECTEDYIVLKDDMSAQYQQFSTAIDYYDVLLYSQTYDGVVGLAGKVRSVLAKFVPNLFPTGVETGAYFDDNINAFMKSIQYRAMRRDKNIKMQGF